MKRAYGYVFQAAGLYPWRTIGGNIKLPLEIMGYDKLQQKERVTRVLELVELSGFDKKFPWQLSGGMQQRASIARALAFDADILLMDEPFGALDEIVRDHLNEQLLKLWLTTKKTIGFVTHSIPEAVFLSSKIVVMSPRPGRISKIITSNLPSERTLEIRESKEFLDIAAQVRDELRKGSSHE
jgi:NitT/TauT family transport system ATP-binding protein